MTSGEAAGLVALSTVIAAIAAAIAKWRADISSQRIARREQAQLDERVKKIETRLAKEYFEHKVRFRRIDKEVTDVLSNVYDKLFVLYECSHRYVRLGDDIQIVDQPDTRTAEQREKEAHGKVDEANRAFKESFFRKKLYVPKELFLSVRRFHQDLIGTVSKFTHSLSSARRTGKFPDSDKWQATMNRLNNEHSRVLAEITEAFQERMGL